MEVPLKFRVKNPLDGSGLDIDLEVGCYFMAAAGPLDEWLEPKQHTQSNTAVNMIAMIGMKSGGPAAASASRAGMVRRARCARMRAAGTCVVPIVRVN